MTASPSYTEILERCAQSCTLHYLATPDAAGETPLSAVLSTVSECRERAGYEQFSLLFHADDVAEPRQGMYAVNFADGVRWDVFLVPVERKAAQIVYEACFNRSVGANA